MYIIGPAPGTYSLGRTMPDIVVMGVGRRGEYERESGEGVGYGDGGRDRGVI